MVFEYWFFVSSKGDGLEKLVIKWEKLIFVVLYNKFIGVKGLYVKIVLNVF